MKKDKNLIKKSYLNKCSNHKSQKLMMSMLKELASSAWSAMITSITQSPLSVNIPFARSAYKNI